ncbi:MAG: energy transducer TonB, partial [Alistipes sp.]|nr:energy transducer TonB [Alistipes sp.]
MHYYDPNDRRPRRWALLVTTCYGLLLGAAFLFVSFDFTRQEPQLDQIVIEFIEPERVAPPPPPPPKPSSEPRAHTQPAPVEQTAPVEGTQPETRTPNPKALFRMDKSGADEPENAGNPRAQQGEEQTSGAGRGLSPDGLNQLDRGLQG